MSQLLFSILVSLVATLVPASQIMIHIEVLLIVCVYYKMVFYIILNITLYIYTEKRENETIHVYLFTAWCQRLPYNILQRDRDVIKAGHPLEEKGHLLFLNHFYFRYVTFDIRIYIMYFISCG